MTLSIIATANHWWIDAAAAAVLVLAAIAGWRVLKVWAGDRRWSWTRMRFQAADGVDQLETLANDVPADTLDDQPNDAPSNVSTVANDDTGDRRSFVG